MKKKQLVVFMIAATAVNMAIAVICFAVFLLFYSAFVLPHIPAEKGFIGIPLLLLVSMTLSFFIYRWVLKRYFTGSKTETPKQPLSQ